MADAGRGTVTPYWERIFLSVTIVAWQDLIRTAGVIDHEAPGSIRLPTNDFDIFARKLDRFTVRVSGGGGPVSA